MSRASELRADFIELLLAYIEGTNPPIDAWPAPRLPEYQPTPIPWHEEKAMLWDIVSYAFELCAHVGQGEKGGPTD